jgi:hypothetical protein
MYAESQRVPFKNAYNSIRENKIGDAITENVVYGLDGWGFAVLS